MDVFSKLAYLLIIGVLVLHSVSAQETPVVPGPGNPIFDDCVTYHEKGCSNQDSYFIKARNPAGYEPVGDICRTEIQTPGCKGDGWTSIGVISDDSGDWSYDSELWTAKGSNQTAMNSQFWSANVTEICLGSFLFSIQIPVEAPSLRSLFFEKRILNMTAQQWIDSITDPEATPNYTQGCFEIGFNVGSQSRGRARLGIVSTFEQDHCPQDVYMLGVGLDGHQNLTINQGYFSSSEGGSLQNIHATATFIFVRSRQVDESASTTPLTTGTSATGQTSPKPTTTEISLT